MARSSSGWALLVALLAMSLALPALADARGGHQRKESRWDDDHDEDDHDDDDEKREERQVLERALDRLRAERARQVGVPEPPPAPTAPAPDPSPPPAEEPALPPPAEGPGDAPAEDASAATVLAEETASVPVPLAPDAGSPYGSAGSVLALTFRHLLVVGGMAMLVALAIVLTARRG